MHHPPAISKAQVSGTADTAAQLDHDASPVAKSLHRDQFHDEFPVCLRDPLFFKGQDTLLGVSLRLTWKSATHFGEIDAEHRIPRET